MPAMEMADVSGAAGPLGKSGPGVSVDVDVRGDVRGASLGVAEGAEERAERGRRQLAVNATWYREKGNKAFKNRDYDHAHALYTKGIRHLPTSKLFCNRSMASLRMGRPQDAVLDASLAVKLEPGYVKAYVRRAAALQKLGKLKEAADDLEKACALGTDGFVLKMLEDVRLCLSRVEASSRSKEGSEAAAMAAPAAAGGGRGSPTQQPEEALDQALAVLERAGDATQRVEAGQVSSELLKLQQLLAQSGGEGTESRLVDRFFASSGASKVFGCFRFDNVRVLSLIRQICVPVASLCASGDAKDADPGARTRARAHKIMFLNEASVSHLETVAECILKRRVGVVSAALDILAVFLDKKEFREHLLEAGGAEARFKAILAMFGKASDGLSLRAGAVVSKVAHLKKFVALAVQQYQHLTNGLSRCCTSEDDAAKALALTILQKVRHSTAILSMLSGKKLAAGLSNLLAKAVASRVRGDQMFVSAAFTVEQLDQLADILDACGSLCIPRKSASVESVSRDFVTELGDKGTWALVIRMIESHGYNLRRSAITLFASACKCLPELSFHVAKEKEAFQIFFDVFANSREPKPQEEVSYIANMLWNLPEFHQFLSTRAPLGDLLKMVVQKNTSDVTVVALCRILLCVSRSDEEFRDKLCGDADLLRILVQLWYGRQGSAKFYALQLLQLLLSEEKASKLLTESASEGQVLDLIQSLHSHKVMVEAYETGGANLFCPPIENDMLVMEKSRLLDQLDIAKLCTYLNTLVPLREGGEGEGGIVSELCSASGTMLDSRLFCTQMAEHMPTCSIYAVDWVHSLVDRVQHLKGRAARNVYCKHCDYETVDQLPVRSDLAVLAGIWEALEDPPQLFQSIRANLRQGGKLVLIERESDVLEDAVHWAKKSSFEVFAEPAIKGGFMKVLCCH